MNGNLTPKAALCEASRNLIYLFLPFLHDEEEGTTFEDNKNKVKDTLAPIMRTFSSSLHINRFFLAFA